MIFKIRIETVREQLLRCLNQAKSERN
jgi:hypothetical protein